MKHSVKYLRCFTEKSCDDAAWLGVATHWLRLPLLLVVSLAGDPGVNYPVPPHAHHLDLPCIFVSHP